MNLPPLPHLGDKFTLEEMQHYSRQAVRDALELAATIIDQGWVEQRKLGMSDAIRALLKEYSNE